MDGLQEETGVSEETHLSDLVTTLYIEGDNQMLLTYYQYFDSLAVVVDG